MSRPTGEGLGRTARMHASEESDSGVVPMNHSNKGGPPPAESEEGRLLIKENTLRPSTCPTQSGFLRVPRVIGCAARSVLSRQSSEIRAVCANERPYGSEREGDQEWSSLPRPDEIPVRARLRRRKANETPAPLHVDSCTLLTENPSPRAGHTALLSKRKGASKACSSFDRQCSECPAAENQHKTPHREVRDDGK